MFHLTEAEIMASWQVDEPIRVSVCCITYKQEQYIAQAIDSFLMQKTTFPFEIIIGEDCSGDSTLDILSIYKTRYPHLIKIITADINMGMNKNFIRTFNAASGEFIAVCEGDDYWIDELKLQKQTEIMLEHPMCNMCITKALSLYPDLTTESFCDLGDRIKFFSFTESILGAKKDFYPTASFFIRKDALDLPNWILTTPVVDYYLHLFGSYPNGFVYLPIESTVYRRFSIGGLTSSMDNNKFITLRLSSYNYGKKLLEIFGGKSSYKNAIIQKQIEYMLSLCTVYLKVNNYKEAIRCLLKGFSLNFTFAIKHIFNICDGKFRWFLNQRRK